MIKNKITVSALVLVSAYTASAAEPTKAYDPYIKENVDYYHLVNNSYAYAPATVYYDGQYHQFYCSTGNLSNIYFANVDRVRFQDSWDHIRYRNSKNGSVWSNPVIAITQSANPNNQYASPNDAAHANLPKPYFLETNAENCACDPAVVYGDDGYWYMLYAGNIDNYNTLLYLARSKNIQGPYEKYSTQGWDRWATLPTPVLKKKTYHAANDASIYGIGQPTIVKGLDGKFHVWFAEMDNVHFIKNGQKYAKRYHVAVDRLIDLKKVNLDNPSKSQIKIDELTQNDANPIDAQDRTKWPLVDFGEVRWNATNNKYEMWQADKYMSENTYIKKYYSTNAVNWYVDNSYREGPYNYIHNLGVSGDVHGKIYDNKYLLSFSGPKSLSYNYSNMQSNNYVDANGGIPVALGIWPMWQKLNNMSWSSKTVSYSAENNFGVSKSDVKNLTFFEGDFDGDGVYELGAVDLNTSKWYLRSSRNSNGKSSIWGKKFFTISGSYKIVYGDFDGDGITDFGVVTYKKRDGVMCGYWRVHSSRTNNLGVPHIPDNWEWYGLTKDHSLLNGDYDGDGIVDLVAFLPSNKTWYMISSMDGAFMNMRKITRTKNTASKSLFEYKESGISGSNVMPIAGDFDGDHITDLTIVDTKKNLWYIRSSQTMDHMSLNYVGNGSFKTMESWPLYMMRDVSNNGTPSNMNNVPDDATSYKYMTGDFDGDGVYDYLMFKPTTGVGKMLLSRVRYTGPNYMMRLNSVRTVNFPKAKNLTDKEFFVGDFDGNGYSDICIVDLKTYKYYIYFFTTDANYNTTASNTVKYAKIPTSSSLSKQSVQEEKQTPEVESVKPLSKISLHVQDRVLNVSNLSNGDEVFVMDVRGKEIAHKTSYGTEVNFNIPARGTYIVRAGKKNHLVTIK
jgi:hypothetical protein